jgi:hypothetical protein
MATRREKVTVELDLRMVAPLRDNALQAHQAGKLEDRCTAAGDMLDAAVALYVLDQVIPAPGRAQPDTQPMADLRAQSPRMASPSPCF